MSLTKDGILRRLTSPYATEANTNNAKLAEAFATGLWAPIKQGLEDISTQSYIGTMSGGSLNLWARVVSLTRDPDESDAHFRIRIKSAIRRLIGGVTPDDMIEFAAGLLGVNASDIIIEENMAMDDAMMYRPGYFMIHFDEELLAHLGFVPAQFPAIRALIGEALSTVAAAGVKVEVHVQGGGMYDMAVYDVDTYG